MHSSRRNFIKTTGTLASALAIAPNLFANAFKKKDFFEVSLAQWSMHKSLFSGKLDTLNFPGFARKEFNIGVVEYVNQFFKDKATDKTYLADLLNRCKDNDVTNHLIMIDGEGSLGSVDDAERTKAIENHYKWVDAAKYLGCKTIRVNAFGNGSMQEVQSAAVDGLGKLGEYAEKVGLNIIVENHGGYTSNGDWLLATIQKVNRNNVGILPDFGNFCIQRATGDLYQGKCIEEFDKYKAVKEWMPYAKGVSAKTIKFDENGNCVETDYVKMFRIIKNSGWTGYMGIEYEGDDLSEVEGIKATQKLLKKVTAELS